MKNEWTDEEVKAVLKEAASDDRRRQFGLAPNNLARLVLDAREEVEKVNDKYLKLLNCLMPSP